jgi:hypothetical protein
MFWPAAFSIRSKWPLIPCSPGCSTSFRPEGVRVKQIAYVLDSAHSTDYGQQARLLTEVWADEGQAWDWLNRVVYLPKSASTS